MEIIFENKVVEGTDIGNRMRFPGDANKTHLPPACSNDCQSARLPVEDENGKPWTLNCRNQSCKMYFADGWKEFREARGIRVGHRINFYKLDRDSSGTGAQYKITVMTN